MKTILSLCALALLASPVQASQQLSYLLWSGPVWGYMMPEAQVGGYDDVTVGAVAASFLVTGYDDGATLDVDGLLTIDGTEHPVSISYVKDLLFVDHRSPVGGPYRIYDDGAGTFVIAVEFSIPEPATWGLMGMGCLAIVALRRRARSR